MAPRKYKEERKQRSAIIGERMDVVHKPKKRDAIAAVCSELERAEARLKEMIAKKDEKGIKKMREIVANLQGTIARSK